MCFSGTVQLPHCLLGGYMISIEVGRALALA